MPHGANRRFIPDIDLSKLAGLFGVKTDGLDLSCEKENELLKVESCNEITNESSVKIKDQHSKTVIMKSSSVSLNPSRNCSEDEGRDISDTSFSAFNSTMQSEEEDSDTDGAKQNDDAECPSETLSDIISCRPLANDKFLFIQNDQSSVYVKGALHIRVLGGAVEVLGARIISSNEYSSLYSPKGHSLLKLTASKGDLDPNIIETLVHEGLNVNEAKSVVGDCIYIVKKVRDSWTKYVQNNLNESTKINLFFRDQNIPEELKNAPDLEHVEKCLDVNLFHPYYCPQISRLFEVGENWSLAQTSVEISMRNGQTPRLLVAGGKGVGKSSFLRWLTNKLLATQSQILFLDLDPGQPELNIPGYLSLSILESPLLGPNYCHSGGRPVKSIYLGDINVSNCPQRYLDIAKDLAEAVSSDCSLSRLPLLVNTMGWVRGVGLMLLVDLIRMLEPSTVVQVQSRFPRKNLPYPLTPQMVVDCGDSWLNVKPPSLSYSLLELPAVPEDSRAQDMRSKDLWGSPDPRLNRDIILLSRLGKLGGLESFKIFTINFRSIALHLLHAEVKPNCLLAALNWALVDLISVEAAAVRRHKQEELYSILRQPPREHSRGFGVIIDIDPTAKLMHLATYLSPQEISSVNCLVGGSTRLPDSLILNLKHSLPYVDLSPSDNPLDSPWQRNFKPRGGRPM